MKKTAAFLAIVLTAALIFSGCSARTTMSTDDFKKKAEAAGYEVAKDASYGADTDSLNASKSDSDTEISFTVFTSSSSAKRTYSSLKKGLTVTGGESTLDSDAYNRYTAQNGEIYYAIVRMDDTLLNCKGTLSEKDEIDQFINDVNY